MHRPALPRRFLRRSESLPAALAMLLLALIAGCGQSGPLYLPGNPSQVQEPPAEESEPTDVFRPANVEEDEDKDEDESKDGR